MKGAIIVLSIWVAWFLRCDIWLAIKWVVTFIAGVLAALFGGLAALFGPATAPVTAPVSCQQQSCGAPAPVAPTMAPTAPPVVCCQQAPAAPAAPTAVPATPAPTAAPTTVPVAPSMSVGEEQILAAIKSGRRDQAVTDGKQDRAIGALRTDIEEIKEMLIPDLPQPGPVMTGPVPEPTPCDCRARPHHGRPPAARR